jgi:hypothetical protein
VAAKKATGKQVIKGKPGAKPVSFQPGGLHKSLGVPAGQTIPAAKMAAAAAGKMGPLAQKQAVMAQGLLKAGRKTAAKNAKKGK